MTKHVALLRGINVGGKNKLPMADLRALFAELGAASVETYIQSGNVVFEASAARGETIAAEVARRLASDLGLTVPIQLRSAAELRKAIAASPFTDRDAPEKLRLLMFLADRPARARIAAFAPNCSAGERYELIGRELHVVFPRGIAGSKFTSAYVDRALDTIGTARNWRTVLRLLEMLS